VGFDVQTLAKKKKGISAAKIVFERFPQAKIFRPADVPLCLNLFYQFFDKVNLINLKTFTLKCVVLHCAMLCVV
jgi:hypothetical protein